MAKLVTEQTANDEAARVIFNLGCMQKLFYYMEESVLLGTKPLVDSIRHFIRDPYRSMTSRFPPFAFVELVSFSI